MSTRTRLIRCNQCRTIIGKQDELADGVFQTTCMGCVGALGEGGNEQSIVALGEHHFECAEGPCVAEGEIVVVPLGWTQR